MFAKTPCNGINQLLYACQHTANNQRSGEREDKELRKKTSCVVTETSGMRTCFDEIVAGKKKQLKLFLIMQMIMEQFPKKQENT
jgi:hypothetical protein